jgi:hypothetical protein
MLNTASRFAGKSYDGEKIMAEAEEVATKSPNDLLAEQVAEALATAGLVPENRKASLLAKLKVGGVKQDDWGLWVDLATAPKTNQEESDHE